MSERVMTACVQRKQREAQNARNVWKWCVLSDKKEIEIRSEKS